MRSVRDPEFLFQERHGESTGLKILYPFRKTSTYVRHACVVLLMVERDRKHVHRRASRSACRLTGAHGGSRALAAGSRGLTCSASTTPGLAGPPDPEGGTTERCLGPGRRGPSRHPCLITPSRHPASQESGPAGPRAGLLPRGT